MRAVCEKASRRRPARSIRCEHAIGRSANTLENERSTIVRRRRRRLDQSRDLMEMLGGRDRWIDVGVLFAAWIPPPRISVIAPFAKRALQRALVQRRFV